MENKYQIIYADPPWDYKVKTSWALAEGGFRNTAKKVKEGTAKNQYNTMSVEELKDLSIHPYQIIYADPPWSYKEIFGNDRTLAKGSFASIKNSGANDYELQYSGMTIEELKNLGIDPYQIVYADPPWHFKRDADKINKNYSPGPNGTAKGIGLNTHYNTMSTDDIAALPIKDIVHKDAACFMWTTDAHLPYALEIMKAWGFKYKTIGFVWVKKEKSGKTVKMLAPWTLKGAEICLFGTRGAMTKHKAVNNVYQVQEELRREHSRKPDIIRDEIKRMFPECRKIELFARTAMPGWDAWGNEVDKFTEDEVKNKLD